MDRSWRDVGSAAEMPGMHRRLRRARNRLGYLHFNRRATEDDIIDPMRPIAALCCPAMVVAIT